MGKRSKSKNRLTYEDAQPVFRVKLRSGTSGTIKYINYIRKGEKLLDERESIGLSKNDELYSPAHGADTVYFGKIAGFDVTAAVFKCNLAGTFMIGDETYPVYMFSVYYKNKLIAGSLCEYWFMFKLSKESKDKLNDPKKYKGAQVDGKCTYGLSINEKVSDNYQGLLTDLLTTRYAEKYCEEHPDEDISDDIMDELYKKAEEDSRGYDDLFEEHEYTDDYVTNTKIKSLFWKVWTDQRFRDIIEVALISRRRERREDAGMDSDEEFQAPDEDKVIKIDDKESIKDKFKDLLAL